MTITVNGAPLAEYVGKQIGQEIAEVRETEAPKICRHSVSKNGRNHSGARTAPGQVIYRAGQRETHVIVAGNFFSWQDKAPYVRSGHSILGAVEYDERTDEVKCHACGKWCKSISEHVAAQKRHGSSLHGSSREYRIRHGFRIAHSPLATPSVTRRRKETGSLSFGNLPSPAMTRIQHAKGGSVRASVNRARYLVGSIAYPEKANLTYTCKAQRIATLKRFAKDLGRTPTYKELAAFEDNGRKPLLPMSLTNLFGVSLSKILLQAGLTPRSQRIWYPRQPKP